MDIANHLGLGTESVSRTLTAVRRLKLIEFVQAYVVPVCQHAPLAQMAEL
ncbi:MAG: transcriptional regulator [Geminicoccaceae bacterium]